MIFGIFLCIFCTDRKSDVESGTESETDSETDDNSSDSSDNDEEDESDPEEEQSSNNHIYGISLDLARQKIEQEEINNNDSKHDKSSPKRSGTRSGWVP